MYDLYKLVVNCPESEFPTRAPNALQCVRAIGDSDYSKINCIKDFCKRAQPFAELKELITEAERAIPSADQIYVDASKNGYLSFGRWRELAGLYIQKGNLEKVLTFLEEGGMHLKPTRFGEEYYYIIKDVLIAFMEKEAFDEAVKLIDGYRFIREDYFHEYASSFIALSAAKVGKFDTALQIIERNNVLASSLFGVLFCLNEKNAFSNNKELSDEIFKKIKQYASDFEYLDHYDVRRFYEFDFFGIIEKISCYEGEKKEEMKALIQLLEEVKTVFNELPDDAFADDASLWEGYTEQEQLELQQEAEELRENLLFDEFK